MTDEYYKRLGVAETADPQQIKRAYYTLVKQYPPEKFPEEYKSLRAAYDVLSNAGKRAEYDGSRALPEDAAYLFTQAEKQERLGRYAQAAEVYEQILRLHPGLTRAREALARAYERQDKTGKAVTVWEALCREAPENAAYAYELAQAYDNRSWGKKAAAEYRRALTLDGGNAKAWVALVRHYLNDGEPEEARRVCLQALGAVGERGVESVLLYAFAVMFYGQERDTKTAEQYLGEIVRILRAGGGREEEPEEVVRFLLEIARLLHEPGFTGYIREMAATLPRIDEELRDELEAADQAAEIESLEEQGFDVLFHDLFATLNNGCDCEDCHNDLLAMECHLLAKLDTYRPQLLRLRKELPRLYALHAEFFGEALRTREAKKLLYRRLKILSKKGLTPAGFGEEGEDEPVAAEPVRRTEPKVGRNDPCPCGSGKKYKKCCGR